MKTRLVFAIGVFLTAVCYAEEETKEYRYKMSLDDEFVVKPSGAMDGEGGEIPAAQVCQRGDHAEEGQRVFADALFQVRYARSGAVRLDGEDRKVAAGFVGTISAQRRREDTDRQERSKKARRVGYGCYAVLTDADVAKKKPNEIAEGEFKYIVRGMIRLSPDSALGFSLMVNELDTPGYRELMDYVQGFVKKG